MPSRIPSIGRLDGLLNKYEEAEKASNHARIDAYAKKIPAFAAVANAAIAERNAQTAEKNAEVAEQTLKATHSLWWITIILLLVGLAGLGTSIANIVILCGGKP